MKNQPILSICIPTYNRSRYLETCLQSIDIQLRENRILNESVEVVVSDNCSTDDTAQVIGKFKDSFLNYKYSVNNTNVGFDRNILKVVTESSGKYCWYLGDDDVIMNGGIEFVCNLLKKDECDFIGVEAIHITNSQNHMAKRSFSDSPLIEDTDFNNFYFNGYCQGGVSVLIFNRELWMKSVNINGYLKHWLYYETVLKILAATTKKMLFIKQPVIATGQDCRWAENGGELFTFINSNLLLEKMIDFGFDKKRLLNQLNQNSTKILIILLRAKGHGLNCNISNLKYIYRNLKTVTPPLMFLTGIIYFIPNWMIVMVRDFKKYLKK